VTSEPSDWSADVDPWQNQVADDTRGGPFLGRMVEALRAVQDAMSEAHAPDDVVADVAEQLERVAGCLHPYAVDEIDRVVGRRIDLPGRGSPLLLPLVIDEQSDHHIVGRVTFRPFHLGGHGAAHGGTLPLLFDEVVGRLASSLPPRRARTAYLTVNYRAITPIGVELRLEATVDKVDGRKRWATGRLLDGDRLLADAEGLFVELRPGQP
jgi:acyl-coenzyme A thioesterase PaaI-like protein